MVQRGWVRIQNWSEPIASAYGFHLVRIEGRREAEVPELARVEESNGETLLGATVRLSSIIREETIRVRFPAFARAVASISSPPLRNMGTLGGNLCVDTRCTYYNQTEEWRRSIDYCLKEAGEICWVAPSSPKCWAHAASDAAPMLCALGARVVLERHASTGHCT